MKNVKLIAFDVDGTLTDGALIFGADGIPGVKFNISDGLAFRMAHTAGLIIAVVSGRKSDAVRIRMQGLKTPEVHLGIENKRDVLAQIARKYDLAPDQTAFVGDDINDIPAFEAVGVKIAVANAAAELKRRADYITTLPGGSGAGREAIETILKAQGRYEQVVEQYLKEISG
jgi:3-deoxy-D-manno-octulosonate 8-phosphate phosphatase (KDO 8-P phosphatase)